ncbi:MAG: hypothetical protein WC789_13825 [Lentisphaeria bacterium]
MKRLDLAILYVCLLLIPAACFLATASGADICLPGPDANWSTCAGGNPPAAGDRIFVVGTLRLDVGPFAGVAAIAARDLPWEDGNSAASDGNLAFTAESATANLGEANLYAGTVTLIYGHTGPLTSLSCGDVTGTVSGSVTAACIYNTTSGNLATIACRNVYAGNGLGAIFIHLAGTTVTCVDAYASASGAAAIYSDRAGTINDGNAVATGPGAVAIEASGSNGLVTVNAQRAWATDANAAAISLGGTTAAAVGTLVLGDIPAANIGKAWIGNKYSCVRLDPNVKVNWLQNSADSTPMVYRAVPLVATDDPNAVLKDKVDWGLAEEGDANTTIASAGGRWDDMWSGDGNYLSEDANTGLDGQVRGVVPVIDPNDVDVEAGGALPRVDPAIVADGNWYGPRDANRGTRKIVDVRRYWYADANGYSWNDPNFWFSDAAHTLAASVPDGNTDFVDGNVYLIGPCFPATGPDHLICRVFDTIACTSAAGLAKDITYNKIQISKGGIVNMGSAVEGEWIVWAGDALDASQFDTSNINGMVATGATMPPMRIGFDDYLPMLFVETPAGNTRAYLDGNAQIYIGSGEWDVSQGIWFAKKSSGWPIRFGDGIGVTGPLIAAAEYTLDANDGWVVFGKGTRFTEANIYLFNPLADPNLEHSGYGIKLVVEGFDANQPQNLTFYMNANCTLDVTGGPPTMKVVGTEGTVIARYPDGHVVTGTPATLPRPFGHYSLTQIGGRVVLPGGGMGDPNLWKLGVGAGLDGNSTGKLSGSGGILNVGGGN